MKNKKGTTLKLEDTSTIIGENSRLEDYWKENGFHKFYAKFRTGMKLPQAYHTVDNVDKLIKLFKLNAIGFGNWVTQEDRFNYMSALTIALYDIDKIIKFKSNVGLNSTVSFSFGARGSGSAAAHFEPGSFIINVTRYEDSNSPKEWRFITTGGAGAVAHEYGHAIDYYFGIFVESNPQIGALSGGRSTRTNWIPQNTTLRKKMDALLDAIIWNDPQQYTAYYNRLKENFTGDYMFRRNELFARCFERYIQIKLADLGISNHFLTDPKYSEHSYLTRSEMTKIIPLMDDLIKVMGAKL